MKKCIGIYLNNLSAKQQLIDDLQHNDGFRVSFGIEAQNVLLFSNTVIAKYIDQETRHDKLLPVDVSLHQLTTKSSGQQRLLMLRYLIEQKPDCLVIDDLFSNFDAATKTMLANELQLLSHNTHIVQLFYRQSNALPFLSDIYRLVHDAMEPFVPTVSEYVDAEAVDLSDRLALLKQNKENTNAEILVDMRNVRVAYYDKLIVHNINWQICAGEFWQLKGPNGSGKTTLISLITGDNPHAYGQDLWLFGRKKGSGESIWEIKSRIGYFTPQLLQQFSRQTKIDEMIISGLYDSIGLYTRPTDNDKYLAKQWLKILGIEGRGNHFHALSPGMQRLVMVARALIKQPDLLILDEPSTELDDHNVQIFVGLVNAIAKVTNTAIIYVSHNDEPGLAPHKTLELLKTNEAYTAIVR